ncbi:MAG TPA: ATP-binding protein [Candidatus Anoxymicrobiaceae bacterium]
MAVPIWMRASTRPRLRKNLYLRVPVYDYLIVAGLLIIVTLLCKTTGKFFNLTDVAMLYLVPVLYAGARTNLYISAGTSVVGVLLFDLLFVPPLYVFSVSDLHYLVTFAIFLVVGIATSVISTRLRWQAAETNLAIANLRTLYDLSKELTAVTEINDFAGIMVRETSRTVGDDTVIYLPDPTGRPELFAASDPSSSIATSNKERGVAEWTFENGQEAGYETDTLPGAEGFYVPMKLEDTVLGVIGVNTSKETSEDLPEKKDLVVAVARLATLALNKMLLSMTTQHVKNLEESERLRTALFNSMSHEFRTPLASITGAVTSLMTEDIYSADERADLLMTIEEGATRMNRLVRNLLDIARIESGTVKLNLGWCDIPDIIGVAVSEYEEEWKMRPLEIQTQEDLPLIKVDCQLLSQVLSNLIDNAIKYSPQGSEVRIAASADENSVVLSVADRGQGISNQNREKVFEKFYRLQTPMNVSGTGLGLSICKGIVEAHGGGIRVEDNPGGGSVFVLTLPAERLRPEDILDEGAL